MVSQCTVRKIKLTIMIVIFNIRIILMTRVVNSPNRKRHSAKNLILQY